MSGYEYVPLHVHSDASLDGAGTVYSLVAEAKRLNFSHLALTDHGTLGNSVAFWTACKDVEIEPILGMEAYLMYEAKRYHITLLSTNEQGFNNLVVLDTRAHSSGFQAGYPLITMADLEEFREGIFALTGCASSAMYQEEYKDSVSYVSNLIDALNRHQVGVEVQFLGTHNTWSRPMDVADELNIPFFITNDTHYPCRHQFPAHQAICKARRGFTYDSEHLWLKSGNEIAHEGLKYVHWADLKQGMENTVKLAQILYQPFNLLSKPTLPHIPNVQRTLFDKLLAFLNADIAAKGEREERVSRLKAEWKVLRGKGFLDYIYILWDIVSYAKSKGIVVGPGRGSGGGCYILYLLGVTDIDPIEHNLIFERFLNPERVDYPDVDVDFESDRRGEVIEYANNRWGAVPIATYSCYSHKSAVHDIARSLAIPQDLEVKAAEASADSEIFKEFLEAKEHAAMTYLTMLGQIRHKGKHAAGVVIANRPVPLERAGEELVVAWAEGMNTKDLSKVGLVKFDLLGLSSLSMLKKMEELTSVTPDESLDDPAVYDLFCSGDVAGIFQWSGSDGIRELTQRIAPRNFYDLTTCNALYRPGALDAGTAEKYPQYMKSPRLLEPRIDRYLKETYGVLCYQEQVMNIVAEVMGGGLAQADIARRLLAKAAVGDPKWEKAIRELCQEFMLKGESNGFDIHLLEELWDEVYKHSGYSYNLSHASAYTLISYRMAWYKVYHRSAFTVAVLQYDKENAQTYILDAVEHGLEIRTPSINESSNSYDLRKDIIYLPLSDVAYLGEAAVAAIIEERTKGEFTSYADFNSRITRRQVNNRARSMLEAIGGFRLAGFPLAGDPADAVNDYESVPTGNKHQLQMQVLGYVVPDQGIIKRMKHLGSQPAPKGSIRFVGFITKVTKKKSAHGEYVTVTLSPFGSFWVRGVPPNLKVGAFVSGTKSAIGQSKDVKVYKL